MGLKMTEKHRGVRVAGRTGKKKAGDRASGRKSPARPSARRMSSYMEDYLESIADLKRDKGIARVRDISVIMRVRKPTVTSALNTLLKSGLIVHEKYGYVELTDEGKKLAETVQKRHSALLWFLINVLKVGPAVAEEDACGMEHTMSEETIRKLIVFIEKVKREKVDKRIE